jgi:hypothetical protein
VKPTTRAALRRLKRVREAELRRMEIVLGTLRRAIEDCDVRLADLRAQLDAPPAEIAAYPMLLLQFVGEVDQECRGLIEHKDQLRGDLEREEVAVMALRGEAKLLDRALDSLS